MALAVQRVKRVAQQAVTATLAQPSNHAPSPADSFLKNARGFCRRERPLEKIVSAFCDDKTARKIIPLAIHTVARLFR
jgi:hypothetical protein